jgi:hypothetical protein
VTRPFSSAFKSKMIQRMTGRDAVSATELAAEVGLRQQTLSRWLNEGRSLPDMPPRKDKPRTWLVEDKVRILAETRSLSGEQLSKYLEREGLTLGQLEQWKLALEEEGRSSKATSRRIRELERELARKEKALAEAAALLILKKKIEDLSADEDDDIDDEIAK